MAHRRLRGRERCQRTRVPDRARWTVVQGQVRGNLQSSWAMARHSGRNRGCPQPSDVARCERGTAPERVDIDDDLRSYFIVHYLNQFLVLEPGDLIDTGTPPGVGMGLQPQVWLKAGDVMEVGIEGLGIQRQAVIHPIAQGMPSPSSSPRTSIPAPDGMVEWWRRSGRQLAPCTPSLVVSSTPSTTHPTAPLS